MSACEQVNQCDHSLVEKQKERRKTYFTYWSSHELENWDLQAQPTITSDELEEVEELERLIGMEKEELDRKKFPRYNSVRDVFKGAQETIEIKDGERRTTRLDKGSK